MANICVGLVLFTLAGTSGIAQEDDVSGSSGTASVTTETREDITVQNGDEGPRRRVRVERRLPGGAVEVEEFEGDKTGEPKIRRRLWVVDEAGEGDDDESEERVEVRPQIRVFPRERELVVRRGPVAREMRIDLDSPSLHLKNDPVDESIGHLQQAIRQLKKARMPEAAERLEEELRKLRSQRAEADSRLNEELRSLRKERDALKEEIRKLRDSQKRGEETDSESKE